jgi:MoxR-like ATPase
MYAGMAAYQNKDLDKAVKLLEDVNGRYAEQELYRLSVLEKAWTARDAQKAAHYKSQIQAILDKNEAQEYYKKNIIPLINALDK